MRHSPTQQPSDWALEPRVCRRRRRRYTTDRSRPGDGCSGRREMRHEQQQQQQQLTPTVVRAGSVADCFSYWPREETTTAGNRNITPAHICISSQSRVQWPPIVIIVIILFAQ